MRMVPRLFSDASIRTLGPQIGMSPLHRVLAFWSMALSHSSLPLASLQRERERRGRREWRDRRGEEERERGEEEEEEREER